MNPLNRSHLRCSRFPCRARFARRRGISISTILVSLLIVVLAVLAGASTVVALNATKARQKAEEDFARSQATLDALVKEIANHPELKSFKMLKLRDSLLKPALAYYESYVQAHAADQVPPLNAAAAQFRVAGLHAKMGSGKSLPALAAALVLVDKLREAKVDPETYPGMQECAMGIAAPEEWIMLKGASMKEMQMHAPKLVFGLGGAMVQYGQVTRQFPQAIRPRDELAQIYMYSGALQARAGRRKEGLGQLGQSRKFLEGLVRDQPGNSDFQRRLADVCVLIGDTEKREKNNEAATAAFEKAVEVREALAAANPDDKEMAAQLAAAKKSLDSVKGAAPATVAAAPAEGAPADAPPAETAPTAEAPVEAPAEAPAEEAPTDPATTTAGEAPADEAPADGQAKEAPSEPETEAAATP